MKKWMTWLLTGLLLIGTLTGCGKAKEDGGASTEPVEIRVGSLKGPTSMGLVWLMDRQEQGLAKNEYTFTMEATADMALTSLLITAEPFADEVGNNARYDGEYKSQEIHPYPPFLCSTRG